jgi:hypothetical protein
LRRQIAPSLGRLDRQRDEWVHLGRETLRRRAARDPLNGNPLAEGLGRRLALGRDLSRAPPCAFAVCATVAGSSAG